MNDHTLQCAELANEGGGARPFSLVVSMLCTDLLHSASAGLPVRQPFVRTGTGRVGSARIRLVRAAEDARKGG